MLFVFSPAFALDGLSQFGASGSAVMYEYRAASVRDMQVGDQRAQARGAIASGAAAQKVRIARSNTNDYTHPISGDCLPSGIPLSAPWVPAVRRQRRYSAFPRAHTYVPRCQQLDAFRR